MSDQPTKTAKIELPRLQIFIVVPPCPMCKGVGEWDCDLGNDGYYNLFEIETDSEDNDGFNFKCENDKCPIERYKVEVHVSFDGKFDEK